MSNEYVESLVARARAAFKGFGYATQQEVDFICARIAREIAFSWPGDAELFGADVMASI